MPSRPTCSAWWVEGLCSCGIMRVGKVTYARRAAWKGTCTSCGMEPSDGARESDGRVYPMFAAAAGDESAYKRRRLPPSKPRAAKSRARLSTTTLLAAWGQEARAPSPPPAQPMQRTVRGTATRDMAHPFFAKRETKSAPMARVHAHATRPLQTVPAPWPEAPMVHVVPSQEPRMTRQGVSWPRRARSCSQSASDLTWSYTMHPSSKAADPCMVCEAAMVPSSSSTAWHMEPRSPLTYLAADPACQRSDTHASPVIAYMHERLSRQERQALSPQPHASAHASLWMDHWRPTCAAHVLGNEASATILRDWLQDLRVSYSGATQRPAMTRRASRRRDRPASAESSEDEFQPEEAAWFDQFRAPASPPPPAPTALTNGMVLVGPTGVGKSAAVYACASELGFEVFELYPGMGRRSGKDLAGAVGQLTRNHMVLGDARARIRDMPHQSLILLDEADVLFDDDIGFWPAVAELMSDSLRPVVLTCTDLDAIPLADLPIQRVLTWHPAPVPAAATYLQLVALAEGYIVSHAAMQALYLRTLPPPDALTPRSGPVMPTSHAYPSSRVVSTGAACDLRAALAQLPWLCMRTRAKEMLEGTVSDARPGVLSAPSEVSAPRAPQDDAQALRAMCRDAEALSVADVVCRHGDYVDEYVPLPKSRAHVSPVPSVPCASVHVPATLHLGPRLYAALAPRTASQLASLAARMDHDRVDHCRYLATLVRLLHVPPHEQLPRSSIPLDYAPYVRILQQCDAARQHAWAAYLYNAQQGLSGRATRNSARFALDGMGVRGWQAWLPFGPAELAAVRATAL